MTEEIRDDALSNFRSDHNAPSRQGEPANDGKDTWEQKYNALEKQLVDSQRMIGEQGRLLGEYRSLIESSTHGTQPQSNDLTDDDFITAPKESTLKTIDSVVADKLKRYENEIASLRQESVARDFESRYPKARALLTDQKFLTWANTEHGYLATKASQGDLEAAGQLFDYYEKQAGGNDNSGALRAASVETGSAGPITPTGSRKPISREKYRQALQRGEKIPPAVMAELYEAYRTGNVNE